MRYLSLLMLALALVVAGCTGGSFTVTGTVQTEGGAPMSGVTIVAASGATAVTNQNGQFSLEVPGATTVSARLDGWTFQPSAVEVKGEIQIHFVGRQVDLNEGLVGYWNFDGTLGDGTWGGDGQPTFVDGVIGQAIQLNGTDQWLDLGNAPDLKPAKLTLAFWIKRTANASGERIFFWAKNAWNGPGWYLNSNGNSIGLMVDGYNYIFLGGSFNGFLPLNEWVHIAVTFDSDTGSYAFYKNGERLDELQVTNSPQTISQNNASLVVGRVPEAAGWLPAALDDVRIYDRVLSQREIQQLVAMGP